MKLLIVGGSGYIGINLRKHLADYDCDHVNYDQSENFDILDDQTLYQQMKKCNAVIHLAAIPDVAYCEKNIMEAVEINVYGTRNVAENARRLQLPLIFSSTMAAKTSHNIYGMTKRIGEMLVLRANGVVLRFSNVYGGFGYLSMKHSAMASFIGRKRKGVTAQIFGDGGAKRDFVHIRDVCEVIIRALGAPPGIYEVCTGHKTSILELAEMIGVKYEFAQSRAGDINEVPTDPNYEALGWKPQVKLEDGIKELMNE